MTQSRRDTIFAVATVIVCCLPFMAAAQRQPVCERYGETPLGAKIDLFATPMPTFDSGEVLPSYGAFTVRLKSSKRVVYSYKSPNNHDAGMGGVIAIEYVPAGRVRIALSDKASIDTIQDAKLLPQAPIGLSQDCPGLAQIVEVVSKGGPLVLQVSGADVELLKIIVIPIQAGDAGTASGVLAVSAP